MTGYDDDGLAGMLGFGTEMIVALPAVPVPPAAVVATTAGRLALALLLFLM